MKSVATHQKHKNIQHLTVSASFAKNHPYNPILFYFFKSEILFFKSITIYLWIKIFIDFVSTWKNRLNQ